MAKKEQCIDIILFSFFLFFLGLFDFKVWTPECINSLHYCSRIGIVECNSETATFWKQSISSNVNFSRTWRPADFFEKNPRFPADCICLFMAFKNPSTYRRKRENETPMENNKADMNNFNMINVSKILTDPVTHSEFKTWGHQWHTWKWKFSSIRGIWYQSISL